MTILDTNILIEILKNNQQTIKQVGLLESHLQVSVISAMELLYGARNKQELLKLQQFLELFEVLHIDNGISKKALKLILEYSKSHALDIPDGLIAATCIQHKLSFLTYNFKDFRFIPELDLMKLN